MSDKFPEDEPRKPGQDAAFRANLPLAVNTDSLIKIGFVKQSGYHILPNTQTFQFTYLRGNDCVTYNGTVWRFNGVEVETMNEIK